MISTYKTVMIEGNDLVHIVYNYDAKKGGINFMLCGISNSRHRMAGDLRNSNKTITEVNKNPTCPECAKACLYSLNKEKLNISAGNIIFRAYSEIFGTRASKKGKCNELHQKIVKSSHNYPYIPNSNRDIAINLSEAFYYITKKRNVEIEHEKRSTLRFLDAGCGIGNIVTLASAAGFTAHGIELNGEYLKIARKLTMCMNRKPYFECANIITFNRYHQYDLVYYYVPIQDSILQTAFEVHLIRGMKVGAFMLPTGSAKCVSSATKDENYFKRYNLNSHNRRLFEKVREVPKNWIPKAKWLRKEYRSYVTSVKKKEGGKN